MKSKWLAALLPQNAIEGSELMANIVTVKNLKVVFNEGNEQVYAVNGVDLSLHQDETLALVGESGSGKSVATHALLGLLGKDAVVTADEMLYGEKDLLQTSRRQYTHLRGQELGLIFQDPLSGLNPTMRIGRQIGEGLKVHRHVHGHALKQAVFAAIEDVGLADPALIARKYPHELSGGQRQRAMIAMALVMQPKVLIADEPTTALDVTLQAQILALIKAQKVKHDLSVIFITHDLGVVANIADRVAIMYAGKIVEVGTANEIFYHPQHPYTWGLLDAVPSSDDQRDQLFTLPGTPPDLHQPIKGDAFAPRNPYAMPIDFKKEPPLFQVSSTHFVRSWLLDPRTPHYQPPVTIQKRWARFAQLHAEQTNDPVVESQQAGGVPV